MSTRKPNTAPTSDTKKTPKKRALPAALAENARALKERAEARSKARGEAALAIIREKLGDMSENVLDIGAALTELVPPAVFGAVGYASFEALVNAELGISLTTANRWMALAQNLKREFVVSVGHDRARALMELCAATPEDDTPEDILEATLTLPSGEELVVKTASADALDAAAREFRHALQKKPARGFTTSPEDRRAHKAIEKLLKRAPAEACASTRLVATRDGAGPKVILEARLPAWDATIAALARSR